MSGRPGSRDFSNKCDGEGSGRESTVLEGDAELLLAASVCPCGQDLIEKGKLRIHSEE